MGIGLLVTAAGHLRAADPPAAGQPTVVAMLHAPDGIAIVGGAARVQARCGGLSGVALVEQAEAAAGRTALGRLLEADLFAVLTNERPTDGKVDPVGPVRLVICETSRGLRLAVHAVKRIEGENDVAAVVNLVGRSVDRRGRPITGSVAVPPFVSDDLDLEYQSLQRPYTTVAEQVLLERPGVLVVELAEARALADEQALGDRAIARTLPLFLLGEFRHDPPPKLRPTVLPRSRLLALDPVTGRARTISTAGGPPPLPLSRVSITPVGEGRVGVIGHVTRDDRTRARSGMVTLDIENARGTVTVLHKSRDVAKGAGGTDVDAAFRYSQGYPVANPDMVGKRRLIACVGERFVTDRYEPKVVAAGYEVRPMSSPDIVVDDGTMHWVWNLPNDELRLFSLGHADAKPRHFAFAVPCGCLARWHNRG